MACSLTDLVKSILRFEHRKLNKPDMYLFSHI